jgi:hypothetical protein
MLMILKRLLPILAISLAFSMIATPRRPAETTLCLA